MAAKIPKQIMETLRRKVKQKPGGAGGQFHLGLKDFDPELKQGELDSLRLLLQQAGIAQGFPSWVSPDTIAIKLSRRGKMLIEKGRF
jgi:hypothetical protein